MITNPDDTIYPSSDSWFHSVGLTKREYFAAMALQGLLANNTLQQCSIDDLVDESLLIADRLIIGLNR